MSSKSSVVKEREAIQAKLEQGVTLHQQGKLADAEHIYREVLQQQPNHFDALHLLGVIALQTWHTERGADLIKKAIGLNPTVAAAHSNLGKALLDLKRPEHALASLDKAIALEPRFAIGHNNRGRALVDLNRSLDALASFDKAIALEPELADAHSNRGMVLENLKRSKEALTSCDRAIAMKPDFAEAYSNRGMVLVNLNRSEEALVSCDKAIALKPGLADAHNNRGSALRALRRLPEALASFDKAIALKPDFALAYRNCGKVLEDLKRHDEAFAAYDKAFALKSDLAGAEGQRLHAKMRLCDWTNWDSECAHLVSAVRNGHVTAPPFVFLAISSSSAEQLQCAKLWVAEECPPSDTPIWQGHRYKHNRIRVAYVSADFHNHATAFLATGLFESHDRSRFETIGVSFGHDANDEMRVRLRSAFDRFLDVRQRSDSEIAAVLRELEVDVAIDLKGFTHYARPMIFAERSAPIQVSYLGYPGSMGASYIDYIVADRTVIPAEHERFYTEKIAWLPDSYQVNDAGRRIAERTPPRDELGLPNKGFVFCCFNSSYKITPQIFDIWMRLVKQVEGSVLWLFQETEAATRNLRVEAKRRGVEPQRLAFAPHVPLAEHLARLRQADLFLDTLPYNAHTTASDALWAGVPVVTCLGSAFAGRVAASLLRAVGLPELVTESLLDYEALALKIGKEPAQHALLKDKLARNRELFPLFDTKRFTRHIETAYTTMWQRYQRGEPPQSFAVDPP